MSTSPNPHFHNLGDFYPRKFGPKPDVVPSGVTERKVVPLDKPDMVTVDVLNVTEAGLLCYMLMLTTAGDRLNLTFPPSSQQQQQQQQQHFCFSPEFSCVSAGRGRVCLFFPADRLSPHAASFLINNDDKWDKNIPKLTAAFTVRAAE